MTFESLRAALLEMTDVAADDFDPDSNLVDFGLDSLQVFELIERWQELGIDLDFATLAEEPTLNGWWRRIASQLKDTP